MPRFPLTIQKLVGSHSVNKKQRKWFDGETRLMFAEDIEMWSALRRDDWRLEDVYTSFVGFSKPEWFRCWHVSRYYRRRKSRSR